MKKLFTLFVLLMLTVSAEARIRIDLNNPNTDPMPLALVDFHGSTEQANTLGMELRNVIAGNLLNSTLFDVTDPQAYLQSKESIAQTGPQFADWRLINVVGLLTGSVQVQYDAAGAPQLRVEYRLFDVHGEKQLVGRRYTVAAQFWRHIAHRISDDIYEALTGESGHFTTRIVHIGEEPNADGFTNKRLCVMDQDGGNYQCLTDGSHLVLTPRFNPNVQKIIYMSYENGFPRLYLLDLPTGEQTLVGDFEGLNSSPRFSPDGKQVVMTLTKGHEGNSEIYRMNLRHKKLTRLTFHRGIDTSPSYSPDGKQIVFNSDRGGRPALYIMDADGNRVRRLTYGQGRYYAPVWSPRGDLIAFVKQLGSTFHIGVIDPEGREERLLTDSYLDESPTWSPNGRVIAFARQEGDTTKIYSIDLTGYNLREVETPTDASDPAWSPVLQ